MSGTGHTKNVEALCDSTEKWDVFRVFTRRPAARVAWTRSRDLDRPQPRPFARKRQSKPAAAQRGEVIPASFPQRPPGRSSRPGGTTGSAVQRLARELGRSG